MTERLIALSRMEGRVRALLPFESRGITTLKPDPQLILATIEVMRRRLLEDGAYPPVPESATDEGSSPARRRRQRQAKVTAKSRLLFFDVETTGASGVDRVVSLGMVRITGEQILDGNYVAESLHLIFNPGRPSDPAARRVHGWTDEVLARQPAFAAHADTIRGLLADSDVWLAHDLSFDLRFLERELEMLDRLPTRRSTFCTMKQAKSEWRGKTSRLDACIGRIGLSRAGQQHSALEDAVLCAALFAFYRTGRTITGLPACPPPSNFVSG